MGGQPFRTLAVTVGTSLAANLRSVPDTPEESGAWVGRQPAGEQEDAKASVNELRQARRCVAAGRWEEAGAHLAGCRGTLRVMGAEIASLDAILARYPRVENIYLLHSDTDEGKGCASAIRAFLDLRRERKAVLRPIGELDHRRPDRFRVAGLRNLVHEIARIYRDHHAIAIDATGGYKAQTAMASMTGQALGVPVLYRFEEFGSVMEFPPLPFRLDLRIVRENLGLIQTLGSREVEESVLQGFLGEDLRESNPRFARTRTLLEGPVTVDGRKYWTLSPFGTLLYERWLSEAPTGAAVLPNRETDASTPDWSAHHRAAGVDAFVRKLIRENSWITGVSTAGAAGLSHRPDGVTFDLWPGKENPPDIRCIYVRDNHPELLRVRTTARNRSEQEWALRRLVTLSGRSS